MLLAIYPPAPRLCPPQCCSPKRNKSMAFMVMPPSGSLCSAFTAFTAFTATPSDSLIGSPTAGSGYSTLPLPPPPPPLPASVNVTTLAAFDAPHPSVPVPTVRPGRPIRHNRSVEQRGFAGRRVERFWQPPRFKASITSK